jgi:prolyl oligopeptidase
VLQIRDLTSGKLVTQLPLDVGTVTGFSGKKKFSEIFYQFASFLTPGVIYRCDLTKPQVQPEVKLLELPLEFRALTGIKFQVYREIEVKNFDASLYETEQVFYASKDGTKIPMFIVHKKVLID